MGMIQSIKLANSDPAFCDKCPQPVTHAVKILNTWGMCEEHALVLKAQGFSIWPLIEPHEDPEAELWE